jgi:hypothetical protein
VAHNTPQLLNVTAWLETLSKKTLPTLGLMIAASKYQPIVAAGAIQARTRLLI